MATELSMNGRKKIETLQKEFTEKFPYLTLIFLDEKRKSIDVTRTLSEVRRAKGDDLSIMGSLKVNTIESRFQANFGLLVEVAYQKSGKIIHTKEDVDKTLNELSKWCQEAGCEKFGIQVTKGGNIINSLLTIQEQLFEGIKEHYQDAEAKKINKDNFLDIYVPSVNPKRGNHLFFNTGKEEIKLGFYCRDEEYNNKILSINANLEAYSQGIRLKGNPIFNNAHSAVMAANELLQNIVGKTSNKMTDLQEIKEDENIGTVEKIDLTNPVISVKNQGQNDIGSGEKKQGILRTVINALLTKKEKTDVDIIVKTATQISKSTIEPQVESNVRKLGESDEQQKKQIKPAKKRDSIAEFKLMIPSHFDQFHFVAMLFQIFAVKTDGNLSSEEKVAIQTFLSEWVGDKQKAINYLVESSKVLQSFDSEHSYKITDIINFIAEQILNKQVFSRENLDAIILDLKDIAKSDGLVSENEKAFIAYLESAWGLN